MPIVSVGKPLRDKLGDDAVDSLVDLLNQTQSEQKNNILEFVEEKFERRLSEEISGVKTLLSKEIGRVDAKISEVATKISETKADLIKWMFIFWVGQVGMIVGILFAFFK